MSDFFDEASELVNEILNYKVTKNEVSEQIANLKSKYGNDIFPKIYFEKSPKPWDKMYMQKLKDSNIAGAWSDEFILHMAEVSEYIVKKKKKQIAFIVGGVLIAAAVTVILLGFALGGEFNRNACLYHSELSNTIYIGGISDGNFNKC